MGEPEHSMIMASTTVVAARKVVVTKGFERGRWSGGARWCTAT